MENFSQSTFLCLFLLYAVTYGANDRDFAIRSQDTNLVLDGTDEIVRTKTFTNSDAQLWKLVSTTNNRNFVVNKGNGKVLTARDLDGSNLQALVKNDSDEQQWYVNPSGSTFVNAVGNRAIDAKDGTGGNRVIVCPKNGKPCQLFVLYY